MRKYLDSLKVRGRLWKVIKWRMEMLVELFRNETIVNDCDLWFFPLVRSAGSEGKWYEGIVWWANENLLNRIITFLFDSAFLFEYCCCSSRPTSWSWKHIGLSILRPSVHSPKTWYSLCLIMYDCWIPSNDDHERLVKCFIYVCIFNFRKPLGETWHLNNACVASLKEFVR